MEGSSSYNPGYPYPYPSHVCAPNFVTVKLSGREVYDVWKTQMLCLLESHDMLGFITPVENKSGSGKEKVGDDMLWKRSDALVKGWILGSLSEQTLVNLVKTKTYVTGKDLWDELQTLYGPVVHQAKKGHASSVRHPSPRGAILKSITKDIAEACTGPVIEAQLKEDKLKRERAKGALHTATLSKKFWRVESILEEKLVKLEDIITINGNTALHVAVSTTRNREFLEEMLDYATENNVPLDMKNSEGSTLLHVAANVGNTEAAKMLVQINKDLLYVKDLKGHTPLARALSNMHTNTYLYLLKHTDVQQLDIGAGASTSGELLVNIISSKDYGLALSFFRAIVEAKDMFLGDIDTVLMAIAQNFPTKLNFWERTIHCMFGDSTCFFTFSDYHFATLLKFKFLEATKRKGINFHFAKELLHNLCLSIKNTSDDSKSHHDYYKNAILEATRQNADEVVKVIVSEFPNAILSINEKFHSIIQYAVIHRSEKVYNLLYQMSEQKNIYRTIKDDLENNLLHLAARLAPSGKLNHISGAALQIQHEIQWFKEVEGFVCPLNIIQKNSNGETPQEVFTREHKELVIDGEKWMKETAQSYTITAALITTIVFAAAITVPGGNKQDNGIPMFTNKTAFTVFAVSDAISLFTSVTSLLMFLSILTARFSEQDFLFKLPTKLIIGLATLFISTTAMIIAFGATLFLLFGQNNPQILAPIVALTCLPITSFVTLQFPLIVDLMASTYGRSIFGKKSDDPFY